MAKPIVFSARISILLGEVPDVDDFLNGLEELLSLHAHGQEYEVQGHDYWEVDDG